MANACCACIKFMYTSYMQEPVQTRRGNRAL